MEIAGSGCPSSNKKAEAGANVPLKTVQREAGIPNAERTADRYE
jgi:hypothetical protein